jgi:hypothetical protein
MKRRDFPQPIYDDGRAIWTPAQFAGQANGHPTMVALVGDFLHAFDDNKGRVSVEVCA